MTTQTSQNLSQLSEDQPSGYKRCTKCRKEKPEDGFCENRKVCRECYNERARRYRRNSKKKPSPEELSKARKLDIQYSINQGIKSFQSQPEFIPNTKPFEAWMCEK